MSHTPLILRALGSFYAGGSKASVQHTALEAIGLSPSTIIDGAIYVQYLIPEQQTQALPIIMIHGGSHSGKTWEETPDGREGWFTLFARAGFAVYNIDQIERGRSGFNTDAINKARGADGSAADLAPIAQAGMEMGYYFTRGGNRFPPEHMEQYAAQLLPDFSVPKAIAQGNGGLGEPRNIDAIGALLKKIGPALLMTHSQGGDIGWKVAQRYPELVRGIVTIEPAVGFVGADGADYPAIPTLGVWGDNLAPNGLLSMDQLNHCRSLQSSRPHIEIDYLPEAGITGNGHMLMMESNNVEIAERIIAWLNKKFPV